MPLRHGRLTRSFSLGQSARSIVCVRLDCNKLNGSMPTEDGLLGASEVDGLDAAGLLELGGDSSAGGSTGGSVDGRDKGALLGRSGSQLPGGVAESTGSLS
jgi:hypothetical protein